MSIDLTHQPYVDRLRRFLGDNAALNVLTQEQESDDLLLHDCIEDAIDEINSFGHSTSYDFDDVIDATLPWNMVKLGATLQVLTSRGILSSRNMLSYNDTGGIQVRDTDTYGRYINYYNVLINKYMAQLRSFKYAKNIDDGYGEYQSELRQDWWWD